MTFILLSPVVSSSSSSHLTWLATAFDRNDHSSSKPFPTLLSRAPHYLVFLPNWASFPRSFSPPLPLTVFQNSVISSHVALKTFRMQVLASPALASLWNFTHLYPTAYLMSPLGYLARHFKHNMSQTDMVIFHHTPPPQFPFLSWWQVRPSWCFS